MFYKLLGMVVWNGGKFVLRQRYGRGYAPTPVVAGACLAVVAALVGAALLAARRGSS